MNQVTFRWTGDAPASGDALARGHQVVAAIPSQGIYTPDAVVAWPPGNQGLLYVRLADDGTTFAGTGQNDHDTAWKWSSAKGWTNEGYGYGPKSCIFRGGTLHVVRKSPAGAVGYRHVRSDGTIVTAAESRSEPLPNPRLGLFEYTDYGDVAFGQLDDEVYGGGIGVRFADDGIIRRLAYKDLRPQGAIRDPVIRRDGDAFAIVAVDLDEHRLTITRGSWSELHAMEPAVPLITVVRPPPIELPTIGRPLWFGFFMFSDGPRATGNCTVAIRRVYGPQARPFIVTDESVGVAIGDVLGHWVAAEGVPGAGVEYIEAWAVRMYKAGFRPVAYWDARTWPRRPELPPESWVCVQAYRRVRESVEDYEASVAREVGRVAGWGYPVVLIPQCYTSNDTLTKDLASVIAPCLRVTRDHPAIVALLPFHASDSLTGRATGLEDHPEVKPLWARVAASLTTPTFPVYAPPPSSPFTRATRLEMTMDTERMDALGPGGLYARVDPANANRLVFDTTSPDDHTLIELTKPDEKFAVRFAAADVIVNFPPKWEQGTDLDRQFETREPSRRAAHESPNVVLLPSGLILAFVEHEVDGRRFTSSPLTLVRRAA